MRFWVILSNLGQERVGAENEGHPVRVFVDTCANCNTMSRKFYETLVAQGLECVFTMVQQRDSTLISSANISLAKIFWFWTMMLKIWLWGSNGIIRSLKVSQLTKLKF